MGTMARCELIWKTVQLDSPRMLNFIQKSLLPFAKQSICKITLRGTKVAIFEAFTKTLEKLFYII